jgi:hypothetical protein
LRWRRCAIWGFDDCVWRVAGDGEAPARQARERPPPRERPPRADCRLRRFATGQTFRTTVQGWKDDIGAIPETALRAAAPG